MRGLLNAGFRRGRKVPRCIGKGSDQKVKEFNVFCPKALAGIGRLPHTIETRKIPVDLVRKRKSERVERFRLGAIPPEAKVIRERFESWASDTTVINKLRTARPHLPDALTDRQQDAWEPLLAIADMAGGEWPKRAREAAKELYSSSAPAMSETVLLLSNIKDAFVTPSKSTRKRCSRPRSIETTPLGRVVGPLSQKR